MSAAASLLKDLIRDTHKPEAEVMALATEAGLRQLWREHLLGRYLRGELNRRQAFEAVGIDWVEMAERQHRAMAEDVQWGLDKTSSR